MSLIYEAKIKPTKTEIISSWVESQEWFRGDPAQVKIIGGYRFDDPDGEVGMQGQFVTAGDETVYHVPMTYRGAPLAGAEDHLMSTMDHSVLGDRWIYDAIGDPLFQNELARVIAQGDTHTKEFTAQEDGTQVPRQVEGHVKGSGTEDSPAPVLTEAKVGTEDGVSSAVSGNTVVSVLRRLNPQVLFSGSVKTLKGTWNGQDEPIVLATLQTKD